MHGRSTPGDANVLLRELRTLLRRGEVERVLALTERALRDRGGDRNADQTAGLLAVNALASRRAGRAAEAVAAWHESVEMHRAPAQLARLLARLAREQRDPGQEIWALAQIGAAGLDTEAMLVRLFTLQVHQNDMRGALASADRLVRAAPACEAHQVRRARCLAALGQEADAEAVLGALMQSPDVSNEAIELWVRLVLDRLKGPETVMARLSGRAAEPAASWVVHWGLGRAFALLDRPADAIAAFDRALARDSSQAQVWQDKAMALRHIGERDASQACFAGALERDPDDPTSLRLFGYEHRYQYGDAAFQRVAVQLARAHRRPKPAQVEVHYAAAKALEDIGETAAAFDQYARAGQLQKEMQPWTETPSRRLLEMLRREYTADLHGRLRRAGYPSSKAVFVIGMPRSGTSLIEQIIASHPQARGAGELAAVDDIVDGLKIGRTTILMREPAEGAPPPAPDMRSLFERGQSYVQELVRIGGVEADRIVDKRPGNYTWAGLLDAAIPGSYFIHARRHPVDTCLSSYRLFFGSEVPYSYDLRDLGRAYRLYHDYMGLWTRLLPPDRLLEVRHEKLVDDFDAQARRIIQFIGLDWNDACADFFNKDRVVRTASAIQVRQPIFRRPRDDWRRYARFIGPLLDELGGLVDGYEDDAATADSSGRAV